MTWPFVVAVFFIAAALIVWVGIEIGKEKRGDDQSNNERHDENDWK